MTERVMNFLRNCWGPSSRRHDHSVTDALGRQDGLLWYKDLGRLANGDFSMSVVQANSLLEDQSQIESGSLSLHGLAPYGTFVGIYDGHGGPETSRYINDHLFHHLKSKFLKLECEPCCRCVLFYANGALTSFNVLINSSPLMGFASEQQSISADVIRKAFKATEEGFLSLVTKQWPMKPQIAAVGSCCLVGIICSGTLYVANLGDSRVVLGRLVKATGEGIARRLVKAALQEAAKKREMRYSDLKKIDRGVRRHFHDDITVIVVFLDSSLTSWVSSHKGPTVSIRGGINRSASSLASYASAKLGNSY
ncbi:hypothetical protein GW17_00059651 [Ensete ventricosum]|nr:hypothetical protein GW17_00059651 [Ensete ventricosum]